MQVRVTGLVWYRREDYARVLQVMADSDQLPPTWDKWFYAAEKGRRHLEKTGIVVERVYLDPDEFARWCEAGGLDVDAKARTRFAAESVGMKYGGTH